MAITRLVMVKKQLCLTTYSFQFSHTYNVDDTLPSYFHINFNRENFIAESFILNLLSFIPFVQHVVSSQYTVLINLIFLPLLSNHQIALFPLRQQGFIHRAATFLHVREMLLTIYNIHTYTQSHITHTQSLAISCLRT